VIMEELRSLEGLGALLKGNGRAFKPAFNRSSSINKVIPAKHSNKLSVASLNNKALSFNITRAYTSRATVSFDFDKEHKTAAKEEDDNNLMVEITHPDDTDNEELEAQHDEELHILHTTDDEQHHSLQLETEHDGDTDHDSQNGFALAPPPVIPLLNQLSATSVNLGGSMSLHGIGALDMDDLNAMDDEDDDDLSQTPNEEWLPLHADNANTNADADANANPLHDILLGVTDDDHQQNQKSNDKKKKKKQVAFAGMAEDDEKEKQMKNGHESETECNDDKNHMPVQIDVSKVEIERFPIEEFKHYEALSEDVNPDGVIGSGSFGIVLKSFHLPSCETVAIKQCRITDVNNKFYQDFIRESMYYHKFKHCPFIVNCLGFGVNETDSKLCIALEYMNLQSIAKIKYAVDEQHVQYIAYSLTSALHELHQHLCVHNDVKPDNILISSNGDVKLTDFGCCIQLSGDTPESTEIIGSKPYYAPEKWLVSPPKYGTKSDIWSMGITLYELVTLTMTLYRECGYYKPPTLATNSSEDNLMMDQKYSDSLSDFIEKCLIWEANDRWSAEQLLKHAFLQNHGKPIERKPFALHGSKTSKNEAELSFMIEALIDYYSSKSFRDHHKENINGNESKGKNGEKYSDKHKIQNLCKYSGCTEKEVNTMIKREVHSIKKKIDKISNSNTNSLKK